MQATLDMGKGTITSTKHSMKDVPLKRASNGHFLLPFCEAPSEFQPVDPKLSTDVSLADTGDIPSEPADSEEQSSFADDDNESAQHEPNDAAPAISAQRPESEMKTPKVDKNNGDNRIKTRKQLLQHIAKNTRQGIVNVDRLGNNW